MSRKICPDCGEPLDMAHVPQDVRDLLRVFKQRDPVWYVGQLACPNAPRAALAAYRSRHPRETPAPTQHEDEHGVYYITAGGQRYHYEWCHDCGGGGCDYCEGTGQVRVDG